MNVSISRQVCRDLNCRVGLLTRVCLIREDSDVGSLAVRQFPPGAPALGSGCAAGRSAFDAAGWRRIDGGLDVLDRRRRFFHPLAAVHPVRAQTRCRNAVPDCGRAGYRRVAVQLVVPHPLGCRAGELARRAGDDARPSADAHLLPLGVCVPAGCIARLADAESGARRGVDRPIAGSAVCLGGAVSLCGHVADSVAARDPLAEPRHGRFFLQPVYPLADLGGHARQPGVHAAEPLAVYRGRFQDAGFDGRDVVARGLGVESATGVQRHRRVSLALSADHRSAVRDLVTATDGLCCQRERS